MSDRVTTGDGTGRPHPNGNGLVFSGQPPEGYVWRYVAADAECNAEGGIIAWRPRLVPEAECMHFDDPCPVCRP